jgi:hypothetical protein
LRSPLDLKPAWEKHQDIAFAAAYGAGGAHEMG